MLFVVVTINPGVKTVAHPELLGEDAAPLVELLVYAWAEVLTATTPRKDPPTSVELEPVELVVRIVAPELRITAEKVPASEKKEPLPNGFPFLLEAPARREATGRSVSARRAKTIGERMGDMVTKSHPIPPSMSIPESFAFRSSDHIAMGCYARSPASLQHLPSGLCDVLAPDRISIP